MSATFNAQSECFDECVSSVLFVRPVSSALMTVAAGLMLEWKLFLAV